MSAPLSPAQQALRSGQLALCGQFAIGGPAWTRERTSGDDVLADTTTDSAAITGYLRKRRAAQLQQSTTGQRIAVSEWRFYDFGPLDTDGAHTYTAQDLQRGDVLSSTAEPSIKARITDAEPAPGYRVYIVELLP
jgi:hypothetical protein